MIEDDSITAVTWDDSVEGAEEEDRWEILRQRGDLNEQFGSSLRRLRTCSCT